VTDAADTTDAGSDVAEFIIRSPTYERLKETGSLDDLELALDDLAVLDVDDDVAMPLDTGDVMHVDINIYSAHYPSSAIPS
jgi:hypothetical protein